MTGVETPQQQPPHIAAVPTPGGGLLGLVPCPGTWARNAAGASLDADLDAIVAWRADALLCLVEFQELEALGAEPLPLAAFARGIDFVHLPIADFGLPDARFEDDWLLHGERLRRLLFAGRRVLVHCRGGLGRSGTVAARLLAEMGVPTAEAIRRVREARPGAIESDEQLRHAREAVPPREHQGRALGSLLAGALGDAFGYAVEFDRLEDIRARFGATGLRNPVLQEGLMVASDDTQMTLFTLEGMALALRSGDATNVAHLLGHVRRAYLDWLTTQDADAARGLAPSTGNLLHETLLQAGRAPGHTCLGALRAGGDGSPERPINDSKGCGGVMRVAPLGFLPHRFDTATTAELARRAAALTHGHADGQIPAALMAACVRELVAGRSIEPALDTAVASVRDLPGAAVTVQAVARARALAAGDAIDHDKAIATLGEGWVAEEALAVGLYAALQGDDLPSVLAIAANHDGDSDSTAAIAGQLHGAVHGVTTLPRDWVKRLDLLAPALRTIGALYAADAALP